MNSNKRQPTRVSKACDRCRRQKQRCDFFRPCSICSRMRVDCTANGSDPKTRAKRRKSSPATTELISPSIGGDHVAVTCAEITADPGASLTFIDPRDSGYQDIHVNDNGAVNSSRIEYHHDLSDESGTWHALDKTFSRGAHPDPASHIPGPAPINFDSADSAVSISRKILELRNGQMSPRATYAIPGGEAPGHQSPPLNPACLVPVRELIGFDLPEAQICDALVETYFFAVHWFSLVIYEPRFRAQYQRIITSGYANRSEYGFLLVLLMVLSLGCKYGPTPGQNTPSTSDGSVELSRMHDLFLKKVRERFMDVMDEESLDYVQLCTLLGSFYLYHGRPRSSFSILGAATKTAQAMGLHRDSGSKFPEDATEERKRVWWTIYTWDRCASIMYGRPLSINDKDCNVPMPREVIESVHFDRAVGPEKVGLATYQERLNQVYRIASPVIEHIYGVRTSADVNLRSTLPEMISQASHYMREWQNNLPLHLALDQMSDVSLTTSTAEKMHKLQALSLQLTYDNLMMIIHRPLLAEQRHSLIKLGEHAPSQTAGGEISPDFHVASSTVDSNFKHCLDSALRVPRIQHKPELLKLAAETHLVAFLGMNLFTSSVVMSVCALSDPLSDTAQEAKRGITRALLVQKSLGRRTSLSSQGSVILEDIVQLILEKEREEMLRSVQAGVQNNQINMLQQNESIYETPSSIYESEIGTSPDSYTTPVGPTTTLSVESGDQGLNNSLISLQRIIQEGSCSRPRPADLYCRQTSAGIAPCGVGSNISGDTMRSNDSDTSWMEDISHNWLWNMEHFT